MVGMLKYKEAHNEFSTTTLKAVLIGTTADSHREEAQVSPEEQEEAICREEERVAEVIADKFHNMKN